jgi:hypothetical protein
MTKLFFFFLLASSCQLAFGDAPPLATQKISYSRDTPKNVAFSLPRKTRRLFWGTWIPQTGAPTLGVQLHESRNNQPLELWEKKQRGFVRINRLVGSQSKFSPPDAKFGFDFYWLDGLQKTTPILVSTRITYENYMPGEYRIVTVMPFAADWKSKPMTQTFYEGSSNAGYDEFTLARDDKGILELSTSSTNNRAITTVDTHAWDGTQFSVVPEKREIRYPPN